jgi:hypothetical protein
MSEGALHTVDSGASGLAQAGMRVAGPYVDTTHGPILYLDGITVSFDGFRALNDLSLTIETASCAASSAPMARARRR